MSITEVENFLQSICDACIPSVCVNNNSLWDEHSNYNMLSQVFAGRATPPTQDYTKFCFDYTGINVHYAMKPAREVQSYTALSTSLVDPCFHKYVLTNSHVEMVDKGFTPKGTYPQRNRCKSHGHCSYLGYKTESSNSHPMPTEGSRYEVRVLIIS